MNDEKQESELTPTGSNLLDGRYAVFGYIVDNYNLLKDIRVGDRITKTTLMSGGTAWFSRPTTESLQRCIVCRRW